MRKKLLATLMALMASLALCVGVWAADLPKATQQALAKGKLDASVLDGLDAELNVPKAWLDGAAKEKMVSVIGTWNPSEFTAMTAPFRERYPFVHIRYSRGGTQQRTMQLLVALSEGQVTFDVVTGFGDATDQFAKMKALADLRDLPGFKNLPGELVASDGTWAAHKLSFRCMAYNTSKVKKEDLPKTWDDLVASPRWKGGKLALSDHANAWLLVLWNHNGEKWGEDFTRRLFQDLAPQRRKEGMSATTALTAAGEFDANIPAPEWVAEKLVHKGAPIAYHCPSPVPITVSQIGMVAKTPHKNAARLFINWMISREGQVLQYVDTFAVPVHNALQTPKFLPFADTIVGKPHLVRDDALLTSAIDKKMEATWKKYWEGGAPGR